MLRVKSCFSCHNFSMNITFFEQLNCPVIFSNIAVGTFSFNFKSKDRFLTNTSRSDTGSFLVPSGRLLDTLPYVDCICRSIIKRNELTERKSFYKHSINSLCKIF